MPSALETLVKILKLEQSSDYQDRAVIGGLRAFAAHWSRDAHAQAKKPEHHELVDELAGLLNTYGDFNSSAERHELIKYMLGRITGRTPPRDDLVAKAAEARAEMPAAPPPTEPPPVVRTELVAPPAPPSRPRPQPELPQERAERPERRMERPPAESLPPARQPREGGERQEPSAPEQEEVSAPRRPSRAQRVQRRRRVPLDPQREGEVRQALRTPVSAISGIGPKLAERLEQIGVQTVEDLLYCFPRRYDDYTQMMALNRLQPNQTVTVIGTVRNTIVIKGRRNIDILNVTIDDGAGTLTASFFGQPYLRSKLERGTQVVFSGKTDLYQGRISMSNPEWELLEREALHTRAIVPVYPLTKGLTSHNMRRFVRSALEQWIAQLPDYMPEGVLERMNLLDLGTAIQQMHFPVSHESLDDARRRLTFDELLLLQLGVLGMRRQWQSIPAEPIAVEDDWLEGLKTALPYALTGAQQRAVAAIREDIAREVPMNRLLQGDVGAGKTVVAALSMAMAVSCGFQAALMAPTSILAEQHFRSISRLLNDLPGGESIHVKLLTGGMPAQERAETLWGLGEGSVHIVIGTHALFEPDVIYQRLGLAVIDEQHRFGVEQRALLRQKGQNPHMLIMTATPIPRTLALTLYADLDLTVLDEMPPGRTPIETKIVFPRERERAYSFIATQLDKGRQAFIIYPLVESSESESMSNLRSAVEEFERLQQEVFPKHQLGLLHGKLSAAEKDEVMAAFSRNEIHLLVATSVVEVGIDVPNASVMMIDGANRFGLAQLHQFRGRVGRGEHKSYCLLVSEDGDAENARLKALEQTTDGFKLAEIDWQMRGAGELLGTRQSGGAARLGQYMDSKLVEEAQIEARTIYEIDPDLSLPEHAALHNLIRREFGESAEVS